MNGRNQIHTDVGKQRKMPWFMHSAVSLQGLTASTDRSVCEKGPEIWLHGFPLLPQKVILCSAGFLLFQQLTPDPHPKINLYFPILQVNICRPTLLWTCVTCPPVNQPLQPWSEIRLARSMQYAVGGDVRSIPSKLHGLRLLKTRFPKIQ